MRSLWVEITSCTRLANIITIDALLGAQPPGQVLKGSSKIESGKANFEELLPVLVEAGQKDHLGEDMVFGAGEDANEK